MPVVLYSIPALAVSCPFSGVLYTRFVRSECGIHGSMFAGADCRSLSRSGRGFVPPLGGVGGPGAAAIGGGMWARSDVGWKLSAAPPASRARVSQAHRSCSAVRGRTPSAILR